MIHRTPFFLPYLYPNLVWRMHADKRELYLTFDDGPVPGPTEFVLQTLAEHNVKATFFCIGENIQKHPDIFMKVVQAGHAIGNHTYNHLKGWQTALDKYVKNVQQCDQEIAVRGALASVHLFRPPYGRITRSQIKALSDRKIIMWDVLTRDYDVSLPAEKCLQGSLTAVRNGSIIVFHDSVKAERNLRYALPRFLEECLHQGYVFRTWL